MNPLNWSPSAELPWQRKSDDLWPMLGVFGLGLGLGMALGTYLSSNQVRTAAGRLATGAQNVGGELRERAEAAVAQADGVVGGRIGAMAGKADQ